MSTYDQPIVASQADVERQALSTGGISLAENIRIAVDTLTANKLRTLLTALGVIIGVGSVVALLAIGRGAQEEIAEKITANGANLLTVRPGSLGAGGFGSEGANSQTLTIGDVEALSDPASVPDAVAISPEDSNFGTITAGSRSSSAQVVGVTPTYLTIHNYSLARGEFINDSHLGSSSNVVVLGAETAETLFPGEDPVGQYIRIKGQRFRVIGVLEAKGQDAFGAIDYGVVVPLTTAHRKLGGTRSPKNGQYLVSDIIIQARDEESIDRVYGQIAATLRERHRLPADGSADDFSINNQQNLIETLTESRRTLTLYLGAIAAISLVVGGIGIMNIMLVSVRERTREIGLRKAIGARERDILTQFLIEALTLSTCGGLLGLLIGVLIAVGVNQSGQARASLQVGAMVLAVGFAMAIGLFFGIEPARRAARLDPIEALRYE